MHFPCTTEHYLQSLQLCLLFHLSSLGLPPGHSTSPTSLPSLYAQFLLLFNLHISPCITFPPWTSFSTLPLALWFTHGPTFHMSVGIFPFLVPQPTATGSLHLVSGPQQLVHLLDQAITFLLFEIPQKSIPLFVSPCVSNTIMMVLTIRYTRGHDNFDNFS